MTFVLTLVSASARAQELDTILPVSIPGYGTPFSVTAATRAAHPEAMGFLASDVSIIPELDLSEGYDSAPNGSTGSSLTTASPSVIIADPLIGFGAYAAANTAIYPENTAQNTSGVTLAGGERAILPNETLTLASGFVRAQETGFALDTVALTRPITFTVADYRAGDEISLGLFSIKPEASVDTYAFPSFTPQNRTDFREALTTTYIPGGPIDLLVRLHATQSNYRVNIFSSDTNQALLGFVDTEDGLWKLSLLAGLVQRQPHFGRTITAPVLEAALDWMPTDLDKFRLLLAREIDDPDEVSAAAYTLTEAKFSLSHQYLADVVFKFSAQAENAAYFQSDLRETLVLTSASANWQLNPALALNTTYEFNDRQANYLRTANEHVVTVGVTWTP